MPLEASAFTSAAISARISPAILLPSRTVAVIPNLAGEDGLLCALILNRLEGIADKPALDPVDFDRMFSISVWCIGTSPRDSSIGLALSYNMATMIPEDLLELMA